MSSPAFPPLPPLPEARATWRAAFKSAYKHQVVFALVAAPLAATALAYFGAERLLFSGPYATAALYLMLAAIAPLAPIGIVLAQLGPWPTQKGLDDVLLMRRVLAAYRREGDD